MNDERWQDDLRPWYRRHLAAIIWSVGFALVLTGELIAVWNGRPGDTISEAVWFIMGIGEPITAWFLASRIVILGFVAWLLLHFGTKRV